MTQQEIKERLGLPISSEGVGNCEQILEGAGVLERLMPSKTWPPCGWTAICRPWSTCCRKQAKVPRRVLQAVERMVGSRRQELVYFNPRHLAALLELDAAAVGHALRELSELKTFTYVPPFRGRAIRMIQPRRAFRGSWRSTSSPGSTARRRNMRSSTGSSGSP